MGIHRQQTVVPNLWGWLMKGADHHRFKGAKALVNNILNIVKNVYLLRKGTLENVLSYPSPKDLNCFTITRNTNQMDL